MDNAVTEAAGKVWDYNPVPDEALLLLRNQDFAIVEKYFRAVNVGMRQKLLPIAELGGASAKL